MKHIIKRIQDIVEGIGYEDSFDEDLSFLLAAWLIENFDDDFSKMQLVEANSTSTKKITPEEAKKKWNAKGKMEPPYWLIDPEQMPIPESDEMWWRAVAKAANEGKISLSKSGRSESYMWSMRYWKNYVKAKYGIRPKRTKDQRMIDAIKVAVQQASKKMGTELEKDSPKRGRIAAAARLIRAARTQKDRIKQKKDAEAKSRRVAGSKKAWETRRGTA